MQATKSAAILLILALLATAAADTAQAPAGDKADKSSAGAFTASCLVKITADAAVLPLNHETVDMLLQSSGVAGKAAREVLGLSPDQALGSFEIMPVSSAAGLSLPAIATTAEPFYGASNARRSSAVPTMTLSVADNEAAPAVQATTVSAPSSNVRTLGSQDLAEPSSSSSTTQIPKTWVPARSYSYGQPSTGGGYSGYSYYSAPRAGASAPPCQEQTVIFRLSVNLSHQTNVEPLAEEFMAALIENLKNTLAEAFNDSSSHLEAQLTASESVANRAEEQLLEMQARLWDMAGGQNLSRNAVLNTISTLNQELQALKMREASSKALMEETTRRIAQTEDRVQEQLNADAVTAELERMLQINEEQLKALDEKLKAGIASQADVAQATERLAMARIELAKRRQELAKSAGGNLIDSLNDQLASSTFEMAGYDAEIQSLQQQLKDAESIAAKADEYELLSLKADIIRNGLQESLLWRDQLDRRMGLLLPPAVSVIGGD